MSYMRISTYICFQLYFLYFYYLFKILTTLDYSTRIVTVTQLLQTFIFIKKDVFLHEDSFHACLKVYKLLLISFPYKVMFQKLHFLNHIIVCWPSLRKRDKMFIISLHFPHEERCSVPNWLSQLGTEYSSL